MNEVLYSRPPVEVNSVRDGFGHAIAPVRDLVHVPAGRYAAPGSAPASADDSLSLAHTEVSTSGFWIGRTPITNRQYATFAEMTGRATQRHATIWQTEIFDDYPVADVTYADASHYCDWLGSVTGLAVRLPTVNEWEMAAAGVEGLLYPWGEHWEPDHCLSLDGGAMSATAVGSFPQGAAPTGALDMVGHVWQWTSTFDAEGQVAIKGGCWMDSAWGLRTNRTLLADPERPTNTTGFRIVVETEEA